MNRDEFCALPPVIALGMVYDLIPQLANVQAGEIPRSPKYDGRLSRKGGTFCWMSEMNLESLQYWEKLKRESAGKGGQYAEKDTKTADQLGHWIKYRRVFLNEPWSGLRNDNRMTAAAPSREPKLHSWNDSPRGGNGQPRTASGAADEDYGDAPAGGGGFPDDDYGNKAGSGDDDIPFMSNVSAHATEAWWNR